VTALAIILLCAVGLVAPLAALAAWLAAYPRSWLVGLALLPAGLSLGVVFSPGWLWIVVAADALLAAVAVADLLTLPRRRRFSFERQAGRVVSLKKPHRVALTVLNHAARPFAVTVRDGVPHELHAQPAEFQLRLGSRSRTALHYALRARRRGAFAVEHVYLRVRSRLGLWDRLLRYPLPAAFHVYPDLQQLGQYALLARTNRLSLLGVRRTRRVGQDHEFERLRDYAPDDNYKHIDWRATARRLKLTVRDYQASQSQRIIFLLDCGRMMTNEAAGLSLLDHGMNAMLMLSYVALRQNDAVGLIAFSDEVHTSLPPRPGMGQMNRLLHACFDRFPRLVESRYDLAFRHLAAHCRKRSLVVLVTNVIDEVNANQVERYLANLVGRHLPLAVLLRDRRLFAAVEPEHPADEQLWPAAAAAEVLIWRQQALSDLQRKGVLMLDCFPEAMTAPLINRYLQVKARHLL